MRSSLTGSTPHYNTSIHIVFRVPSATHICIPITSGTTAWVFRGAKMEKVMIWWHHRAGSRPHRTERAAVPWALPAHPNSTGPRADFPSLRSLSLVRSKCTVFWPPPVHISDQGELRKCQQLLNYLSEWHTGGFLPCRGHLWSVYHLAWGVSLETVSFGIGLTLNED